MSFRSAVFSFQEDIFVFMAVCYFICDSSRV